MNVGLPATDVGVSSKNSRLSSTLPEKHKNRETVELLVATLAHDCVDDLDGGIVRQPLRDSVTKSLALVRLRCRKHLERVVMYCHGGET